MRGGQAPHHCSRKNRFFRNSPCLPQGTLLKLFKGRKKDRRQARSAEDPDFTTTISNRSNTITFSIEGVRGVQFAPWKDNNLHPDDLALEMLVQWTHG